MDILDSYLLVHGFVTEERTHVIRDINIKRKVLQSDDKGTNGVEQRLSKDAWHPLYSIETENGQRWQRMRQAFDDRLAKVRYKERLPSIVQEVCARYKDEIIDSKVIAKSVVEIMWLLLFDEYCQGEELAIMLQARDEWAKTISVRGRPDHDFRTRALNTFTKRLFKHCSMHPSSEHPTVVESVSAVFQPWIISPMINFPDLFASVPGFRAKYPSYDITSPHFVLALLDYQHPFPVIDRRLVEDVDDMRAGDHALLVQDDTCREERGSKPGVRFGGGKRSCPGATLATLMFHHMVLCWHKAPGFEPQTNHRWSGRTNDAQISLYQGLKLFQLLLFRWGACKNINEWCEKYTNEDRFTKYVFGTARLLLFVCFLQTPWSIGILLTGGVGAIVNVDLLNRPFSISLLLLIGLNVLLLPFDQMIIFSCYLGKTMLGDFFASKLDTTEWKAVGLYALVLLLSLISRDQLPSFPRLPFLLLLILHQFVMETGDQNWEQFTFWRHRYGFEIFYAVLLFLFPLSSMERAVVSSDLLACLGYRLVNGVFCVWARIFVAQHVKLEAPL